MTVDMCIKVCMLLNYSILCMCLSVHELVYKYYGIVYLVMIIHTHEFDKQLSYGCTQKY